MHVDKDLIVSGRILAFTYLDNINIHNTSNMGTVYRTQKYPVIRYSYIVGTGTQILL